MARYVGFEEQYQCPYCEHWFVFDDLKRYHSTIICPNCVSNMGSFGVPLGPNLQTRAFVERRDGMPLEVSWDLEQVKNLEELNPVTYLIKLDDVLEDA